MAQDKKDSGGASGIITKRGNANMDKIETSSSAAAMMQQLELPLGSKKGTPTPVSTSSIINSSKNQTAPSVKI